MNAIKCSYLKKGDYIDTKNKNQCWIGVLLGAVVAALAPFFQLLLDYIFTIISDGAVACQLCYAAVNLGREMFTVVGGAIAGFIAGKKVMGGAKVGFMAGVFSMVIGFIISWSLIFLNYGVPTVQVLSDTMRTWSIFYTLILKTITIELILTTLGGAIGGKIRQVQNYNN